MAMTNNVFYIKKECPVCKYISRAIYLANQHLPPTKRIRIIPVDRGRISLDLSIDMHRIFKDNKVRTPTIKLGKYALIGKGVPPWKELYAHLVHYLTK